jgi:hypothetical protein
MIFELVFAVVRWRPMGSFPFGHDPVVFYVPSSRSPPFPFSFCDAYLSFRSCSFPRNMTASPRIRSPCSRRTSHRRPR